MNWFASYHYVFVHFPIALIIMAGIAELMMAIRKEIALDKTVIFLLGYTAVFILFTIATGLTLEDVVAVGEQNHDNLEWHETFAYITLFLVFATLILRVWKGKNVLYLTFLILLVSSVTITAHFGGVMAFGPLQFIPSL